MRFCFATLTVFFLHSWHVYICVYMNVVFILSFFLSVNLNGGKKSWNGKRAKFAFIWIHVNYQYLYTSYVWIYVCARENEVTAVKGIVVNVTEKKVQRKKNITQSRICCVARNHEGSFANIKLPASCIHDYCLFHV